MKLIVLSILVFAAVISCEPLKPVWPTRFSQDFIETFYSSTNHTNVGGYYYDFENYSTRIVRSNGKYEPFCNGYKNYNEKNHVCEHIAVGEVRFIYYPDDNDCCFCCSYEQGCGTLSTTWMYGGSFVGNTTLYGQDAYLWVMPEFPDLLNYVWETTEEYPQNRTLLKIQRNSYDELYLPETRRLDYFAPITVPSICDVNNICPRGMCAKFRGETFTHSA